MWHDVKNNRKFDCLFNILVRLIAEKTPQNSASLEVYEEPMALDDVPHNGPIYREAFGVTTYSYHALHKHEKFPCWSEFDLDLVN